MDTPILIGVGGTGQTVVAAYLRLASMAGFIPAPFYIVDSDTKGPLGGVLASLRAGVKEVAGGKEPALRWMIDPFPTADAERKTFGALFGNLAGERRELFNALFSEEAEQTPIRTGMYGRPAIGATCIRYKILQDDDDLKELKDALRGGSKHVVLVGSCFGGTGSGGVPMLAAEFARLNQEPGYSLRTDAVIFLPWFRLVLPEGGVQASEKGLHEQLNQNFEPNAAAGINYFKDELRKHVDTLMLLGVRDPSQVNRESSESSQGEAAHILNLLAALLVQNHFVGALKPPRGIVGYWYDEKEGLQPNILGIHRSPEAPPLSLLQVIHRAYLRQQWLGVMSTFLENFSNLPRAHQPLFLQTAVDRLKGATLSEDQVVEGVASHLQKMREGAAEHLGWIRSMTDPTFFRFEDGGEKVRSRLYDEMVEQPLRAIASWCDDRKVVARFQKEDFGSPETFAEKLAGLFLTHLNEVFHL